ncbi:MAG: 7-cyano-7-deazaguanine synthase [Dehalococcoidia bacterium]|nr:7-cyano-7-deazaguanine synthase [Dehalococcoidia bacterium]
MEKTAVLASGGLDSCILLADLAQRATVFPLYVRQGLTWEGAEQRALRAFLRALANPNVQPIEVLTLPVKRLYSGHWSVTGKGVPKPDDADDAVYLPGRNVFLLTLSGTWCVLHAVHRIAIGSLEGNPFPDASPEFFRDLGRVLSTGLGHHLTIEAPYRRRRKAELIRRFQHLPLELTLTCMAPQGGRHCGRCQKCEERRRAFAEAGVPDKTAYAAQKGRGSRGYGRARQQAQAAAARGA